METVSSIYADVRVIMNKTEEILVIFTGSVNDFKSQFNSVITKCQEREAELDAREKAINATIEGHKADEARLNSLSKANEKQLADLNALKRANEALVEKVTATAKKNEAEAKRLADLSNVLSEQQQAQSARDKELSDRELTLDMADRRLKLFEGKLNMMAEDENIKKKLKEITK